MRALGLVATRALPQIQGREMVVGPAGAGARIGMSAFWIRHGGGILDSTEGSVKDASARTRGTTMG